MGRPFTLDSAQEAFRDNPTADTARTYALTAVEYWRDEMISFTTAAVAVAELRAAGFLLEAKSILRPICQTNITAAVISGAHVEAAERQVAVTTE